MTTGPSQGEFNIERMCWLAGVSRASYYRHWLDSSPRCAETGLRDLIQKLALANPHYGYRRIAALLRREGWQVNHKCVLRIMREDNLLCLRARPFVPVTTDSKHGWRVVPNLAKGMILNGVDQLWVADITYLHLAEEFAFLAVVLDAFSRKVIGWALDTHLRASLAIEALEMAIADRQPEPGGIVHHSDRGVQYACGAYSELLNLHGIQPSMSRVGNPYDNAKAESFMKTLKQEEVQGLTYKDVDDARKRIGTFIDTVYNTQRLHSALDYLTPEEYEQKLRKVVSPKNIDDRPQSRSLATARLRARERAALLPSS
ncbi:transposase InsO family protein [Rhizobium paranaense]|uniref:Transposase InsO family protein n=2 Tax=Rhizobium paranaense TaxID=1650438 RepID=A0A7W8XWI2_9HYPH|nr:transposase InsO family protein [Rhizobium paranaense]